MRGRRLSDPRRADDAGDKAPTSRAPWPAAAPAGIAVAHFGSNNMISFRYRLKNVPMKIAEKSFTADGVTFPAGSFVVTGTPADLPRRSAPSTSSASPPRRSSALPTVPMHDANVPRVAIYSQWSNTQDLGWYRLTFDKFHVPYDLIFKERVKQGNLKKDYDVILMAEQNVNRAAVMRRRPRKPAAVPEERQVQVPRHVRLDTRHERRLRPGGCRCVRCVPRRAAAR